MIVIIYYLKNFRQLNDFEKFLLLFISVNTVWWIFFYYSISPRNAIYGMVFLCILGATAITKILSNINGIQKKVAIVFLTLFLGVYVINGVVFANIESKIGISDEFLLASLGYREPFGDGKNIITSGQKQFYSYINTQTPVSAKIYWVSVLYNKDLFTAREIKNISLDSLKAGALSNGDYFILTFIDYKDRFIDDSALVYLNKNASLLFKQNYWEIYQMHYK